jgi:hypothetical protein
MKHIIKKLLVVTALVSSQFAAACVIAIINDTESAIRIVRADESPLVVGLGEKQEFGRSDKMASFTLEVQQPNGIFTYGISVEQTACTATHKAEVNASALLNGVDELGIFSFTNHTSNAKPKPGCGCSKKSSSNR